MASSIAFVAGTVRLEMNDRVSFFMERGFAPSVEVTDENTVVETVQVQFRGAVAANVNSLNRFFERARRQDPAEDTVYVEYKVAENEDAWRSKIYDGKVEAGPGLAIEFKRSKVNLEITFERDPFWEGPELPLPISNVNSGKVYNCNDGSGTAPNKKINIAYVTGNLIEGDLPAPAKLVMKNESNIALGYVWIGVNRTRPNWQSGWHLEAESAIGVTPYTISGASGGAIARGSMAYGITEPILRWEISDQLVSQMRGQRLRILLRAHYLGTYQHFKYKLKIKSGTNVVYETDWLRESEKYARHWLDLFDLRMPPWLEGKGSLRKLELEIHATPTVEGTWNWAFDDVMLLSQDSFVAVDCDVAPNEELVINGAEGWGLDANQHLFGLHKMTGTLMLEPRAMHMFYFLMHGTYLNQAPIDMALSVSGTYRPRRWLI